MPIVRTYQCEECFNRIELTLPMEQWDREAPDCPVCVGRKLQQEFKPVAIGGSTSVKARDIAEDIAAKDYHVADMQHEHRPQGTPKVRYQEPRKSDSTWGVAQEALEQAISMGRQSRLKYGSGLDVLQANLKSGAQPDLIQASKKRMIRVT